MAARSRRPSTATSTPSGLLPGASSWAEASGATLRSTSLPGTRFAGLIIESGAANIGRLLDRAGLAESADGRDAKIRAIRLPTLLIHGAQDDLVPLERATELQAQLSGAGAELVVIPGGSHNDLLWAGQEQYFAAIRTLVDRTIPA